MKQKKQYIILTILILMGGYLFFSSPKSVIAPTDYKNATYIVDDQSVTLVNGFAKPGVDLKSMGTRTVVQYFGNEAVGDLNGDGLPDVGFIITKDSVGTGKFYYAVAGIKTTSGYKGTYAVFLGDRIAPQTTEIRDGMLLVNYADRTTGESFVVQPSIGKSIWLKLNPKTMKFGEVVQNFEGEANPSIMTLGMKEWVWVKVVYSDGKVVVPNKVDAFKINFGKDGKFSVKTDCNSAGGSYVLDSGKIIFRNMMSTMMYCDGSQEADFIKLLSESAGYHFSLKGELIMGIKFDGGSVIFR